MKLSKILSWALFALFLGVFFYSGGTFLSALVEYRKGDDAYAELEQFAQLSTQPTVTQPSQSDQPEESTAPTQSILDQVSFPEVNFEALRESAPDAVGWIYLEGTNIHYPLVQAADNSYYLDRLPSQKKNAAGSIYLDYRCSPNFSDRNSIIYGHCMKNGSMFGSLDELRQQSYFDSHNRVLLVTPEQNFVVELFAVLVVRMDDRIWHLGLSDEQDMASFYQDLLQRSEVTSSVTVTPQDRLVTLGTCNYDFRDARLVAVGVLRDS